MYLPRLFAVIVLGYLFGSINNAIIITRLVKGEDIRTQGNFNAGTMNVLRTVGKPWGILVAVLDALKAALPMLISRLVWFDDLSPAAFFAVFAAGAAAIIGHWKPIYHNFKGGRSVGCSLGVYLFIVPFEFIISFLISGLFVIAFIKNVKFKFGQWVPIVFIVFTPFL
ncbi:MAG: glycerol-3-phosphate acyltransferase, partial [Spirochaetales bacterium]|nr:glycerol-3-phosphate acyltransferase [Spirochaetales bacterium]